MAIPPGTWYKIPAHYRTGGSRAVTYTPKPEDLSSKKLPKPLRELVEMIASNIHDVWAAQRISEGWTYGPERSDERKETPCLRPYGELPDSEKDYDRKTAEQTLKYILARGYTITAPGQDPESLQEAELERVRAQGAKLRSAGEFLRSYDLVERGLRKWPGDLRLRQLKALALAGSGAARRANDLMLALQYEGHHDEETLGILARTHKDLWELAQDPDEKAHHLQRSFETYRACFKVVGGYYTGINAATMGALYGADEEAARIAAKVRKQCLALLKDPQEVARGEYYLAATLGEAELVLGNPKEASRWYSRAGELGHAAKRYGDLHSTRRNARFLLLAKDLDPSDIEAALAIPPVAVFTGHIVDMADRGEPRFPEQSAQRVSQAMRKRLKGLGCGFGFAGAAAGGDILFLEALQDLDMEAHVVLPYNKEQFLGHSVSIAGSDWESRFLNIVSDLEKNNRVSYSSDWPIGSGGADAFSFANQVMYGLALLHAIHLDTELFPVALWDGKPGDGGGGTADTVAWWLEKGHTVQWISTRDPDADEVLTTPGQAGECGKQCGIMTEEVTAQMALEKFPARVMTMLFADVVGFSKLREDHIPPFIQDFLGQVADMALAWDGLEVKNTWGDALYLVFDDVARAGCFALKLVHMVNATDWNSRGLPKNLNLRVALHAGPVYSCTDPVIEQHTYTGTHVSRAARIEPITPVGQVYASQAFAALAAAKGVMDFSCEYVGQTDFAKNYGTFPIYHIRARSKAS
ncbi:MAG: hypothetical protein D6E12_08125 [Desulfovibrio sp.]|nr:MAG: hypothetical protein D6E12_08125 [Desulfovibrio sp.]